MSTCDHLLGELCGDKVTASILSIMLDDIIAHQKRMAEYKLLRGEIQTKNNLLDGRKGYLSRFNFCPHCGTKLNWKSIIDGATCTP